MLDLCKICFSNPLPRILHLPPQHRTKDHLYVFDERIVSVVKAAEPHLVGIDDRVVILHRYVLRVASVAFLLLLGDTKAWPKTIRQVLNLNYQQLYTPQLL